MKIILHKQFEKRYQKLRLGEKRNFKKKRNIFIRDPFDDPILNNHALRGKFRGYRSINITNDLRVVYKMLSKDTFLFVTIDTHSNLYA